MKILFVTSRFPYPLEKGDKLRAYHFLNLLSKNHEVILATLNENEVNVEHRKKIDEICQNVHLFIYPRWRRILRSVKILFSEFPFKQQYFYHPSFHKKIRKIIAKENPDLIFCHLTRTAEYVKNIDIPKTIDLMDAFSVITKDEWINSSGLKRWFYKVEYKRTLNYERSVAQHFNSFACISEAEQIKFPFELPFQIVPNGIDAEYYMAQNGNKLHDLVFVGNMGYFPNIEAAKYLVHQILPELQKEEKNYTVNLAGARPSQQVKQLKSKFVSVSGWQEDIRESYDSGKLFVAPLFHGSGLQNKILEAMSMGIPCITTTKVNMAIKASPGDEIMIADKPTEFAKLIKQLLEDPVLYSKIRDNAIKFVHRNFTWNEIGNKLETLLLKTIEEYTSRNYEQN